MNFFTLVILADAVRAGLRTPRTPPARPLVRTRPDGPEAEEIHDRVGRTFWLVLGEEAPGGRRGGRRPCFTRRKGTSSFSRRQRVIFFFGWRFRQLWDARPHYSVTVVLILTYYYLMVA